MINEEEYWRLYEKDDNTDEELVLMCRYDGLTEEQIEEVLVDGWYTNIDETDLTEEEFEEEYGN